MTKIQFNFVLALCFYFFPALHSSSDGNFQIFSDDEIQNEIEALLMIRGAYADMNNDRKNLIEDIKAITNKYNECLTSKEFIKQKYRDLGRKDANAKHYETKYLQKFFKNEIDKMNSNKKKRYKTLLSFNEDIENNIKKIKNLIKDKQINKVTKKLIAWQESLEKQVINEKAKNTKSDNVKDTLKNLVTGDLDELHKDNKFRSDRFHKQQKISAPGNYYIPANYYQRQGQVQRQEQGQRQQQPKQPKQPTQHQQQPSQQQPNQQQPNQQQPSQQQPNQHQQQPSQQQPSQQQPKKPKKSMQPTQEQLSSILEQLREENPNSEQPDIEQPKQPAGKKPNVFKKKFNYLKQRFS